MPTSVTLLKAALFVFVIAGQSPVPSPTPSKTAQEKKAISSRKNDKIKKYNPPTQQPVPVQKNDPPPHEQWADNRSNHDSQKPSTDWITWFTGVLAIVAVLQLFAIRLQVSYMREGLRVTAQAADAATSSAVTAEKAARASEQGLRISERAVISVNFPYHLILQTQTPPIEIHII